MTVRRPDMIKPSKRFEESMRKSMEEAKRRMVENDIKDMMIKLNNVPTYDNNNRCNNNEKEYADHPDLSNEEDINFELYEALKTVKFKKKLKSYDDEPAPDIKPNQVKIFKCIGKFSTVNAIESIEELHKTHDIIETPVAISINDCNYFAVLCRER